MVPVDCGDNPYRFFLLTIKDNKIISNLYVEGELLDPETIENAELTNFIIDQNHIINVNTKIVIDKKVQSEEIQKYKIDAEGKIIKL